MDLTLTNENDRHFCILTDYIREKSSPDEKGWYRLSVLLLKLSDFAKAQRIYEMLLEQTTDISEKANIFHQLGWTKYNQGEYNEAISF